MNTTDQIIKALRCGMAQSPVDPEIHKACEELKTRLQQHFEANEKPEGLMVLKQFPIKPDVWEAPLKDSLSETAADRNEALLSLALEIVSTSAEPEPKAPHFTATAGTMQGPVQSDRVDNVTQYYVGEGGKVIIGEPPVEMKAIDRDSALGNYLNHVISRNRYLQLQGIRSGGRLVHIELDQIYITLRTTREREAGVEEDWLAEQSAAAPGEMQRFKEREASAGESLPITVNEAMAAHGRLVVLGDPGSGKTTLMRYLTLLYARDLAEQNGGVKKNLDLDESERLPILIPFRKVGAFLKSSGDDGTEGHARLLGFLLRVLKNDRIELPEDFFDEWLTSGRAVIFLDGLNEVADPELRRRVSRLVESFTRAYPGCRYIVTSRIVGYTGAARLGEEYRITTIQDFSMADVGRFLTNWHWLVAVGQYDPGRTAEAFAGRQTSHLRDAIRNNDRIRELAINPLMLTVIALVHRDRVKLPDRRAELYAEAVEVLLGKWDEARGVKEIPILPDRNFDAGDKRLMLQSIALHMHENQQKEIPAEELHGLLKNLFQAILNDQREAERAVERFLEVIEQRTGLLAARGDGVYSFSHLTFQEYLAALAVAERHDYIAYTLQRVPDRWWREVILLEAGYLSTQGKKRPNRLIRSIAELVKESEPYHNLVLAAECLRDVGSNRVEGDLEAFVQENLRKGIETPLPLMARIFKRKVGMKEWIEQRSKAMNALVRAGNGCCTGYWYPPYGEPEWIEIPAGEFIMGEGVDSHPVYLSAYAIARVPVTNTQYHLFVKATGYQKPEHWQDERPPKGKESHPVTYVDWDDAMAYCKWLSQVASKAITLPTEAQWERAARGDDQRIYPWGNVFEATRCNSEKLGLGDMEYTTPVGIFPEGASPYGVLDMAGNVSEWCSDKIGDLRVGRGGSWNGTARGCRSAIRDRFTLGSRGLNLGFRLSRSLP